MKPYQEKLVAAWQDYAAGKIDEKALKAQSAGFGIYQQRDGRTMMRLRRPGGVVTTDDLRLIGVLLDMFKAPFCHLTSRLDVQLHGVAAAEVPAALEACEASGFHFRGGGGDTFRNVQVSASSGLHEDSVFDVIPYARTVSDAFRSFDLAYGLPRKIKIGFFDRAADRPLAAVQDLGFIAKLMCGRRVFEVWCGGGIGFKPRVGMKLFDFILARDCCRLAFALTRMFNEIGCRTNRSHARIRFLRDDYGDDHFHAMLNAYYLDEPDAPFIDEETLVPEEWPVPRFAPDQPPADGGFGAWKALATTPLAGGLCAVRLFVPHGNLTYPQIVKLCDALELEGVTKMQLLVHGDLCIQNVPEDRLASLYNVLVGTLGDVDYTAKSFVGHLFTCIGGAVCKTGVNDSPAFGDAVGRAFDKALLPLDTPEKVAMAKVVLNDVRISGCPNCCTNNPLARFGFVCRKTADGLALTPILGAEADPPKLGELRNEAVMCDDVPAWIAARLNETKT